MKRRSRIFALAHAFAFVLAAGVAHSPASAADVPYGYSPGPMPVQEFVSGWYLRGDVGWRTDNDIGDIIANPTAFYPYTLPGNAKLDDIAMFGIGAGYKWSWLRADITTDYAGKANLKGDVNTNDFFGRIDSWSMLANGYIDLGTWGGFTPYIGAGVGFVTLRAYNYALPGVTQTDTHQSQTTLAWAYMAGLAWCFAPKWMLDFSYRRLNYGDVTFDTPLAYPLTLKDFSANEFRIGVRYTLD